MISAYPEGTLHSDLGDLLCILGVVWNIFATYNPILGDSNQLAHVARIQDGRETTPIMLFIALPEP